MRCRSASAARLPDSRSTTKGTCSTRTPKIEYTDSEGRTGRVNIEVASGNYREGAIKAKAAAGFALHANGPAAAHLLRTLGLGGDGSWLRGPADRDPAAVEL